MRGSNILLEAGSLSKQVKWACSGPKKGESISFIVGGVHSGFSFKCREFILQVEMSSRYLKAVVVLSNKLGQEI